MNEGSAFKFFVDQVVRQYQDLKGDIKSEVGALKIQLSEEREKQIAELKDFKQETNKRFENVEKSILDLQQFRWYIAGITAATIAIAEFAMKALDYYFMHK